MSAGRVVSVNVGLPRTVSWQGREVTTAIWKHPVAGARRVGRLTVDGDGQADLAAHGGEHRAVYAYQVGSYRHWEQELDRDLGTADGDWGRFGENLTLDGLPDAEVRIGDRLRIGTTLLEVTQPRVTCHKLGLRLDEPRMPALLTGSGRPGFYLRVLEEGEVSAGDDIRFAARGPAPLTVERVSAMLYTPDYDEDLLRLALDTPALSDGWRWSFQQQLDQIARGIPARGNSGLTGRAATAPAYAGFRPFRVTAAEPETTGDSPVRSLVLEPADGTPPPPHRAGQFVTVRLPDGGGGRGIVRSYSLSAPADGRRWRVSVKREGRASTLVHEAVAVGDVLDVAAPRGDFTPDADAPPTRPLLLVSAGIGVTPVLAMLSDVVRGASAGRPARPVTWVHVARSGAEHAFRDEARDLLRRLPGATSHVRYTRPGPADRLGVDYDATGRLDGATVAALLPGHEAEALVCGPDAFMADVTAMLVAAGADPGRVRTEAFGAALAAAGTTRPHEPTDPPVDGPTVTFARSGVGVRFGHDRWLSLLELAEAADVPAGWSCRTGVCHRCETGLVSGEVDYDTEPLDRPGPGDVLLCVTRPRTDVTLDL